MATVLEKYKQFQSQYRKQVDVNGNAWTYYVLGTGEPVLWLTGGLRRTALAFGFLELLAQRHTVITPDYPPVHTIGEYLQAFDLMLKAENIASCVVAGQSYGGMLAQAWLSFRPQSVARLILSSSGPADYGKGWLPVENLLIGMTHLLPEKTLKKMLAGGLFKLVTVPEGERQEWQEALQTVLDDELSRADVISHFAVAADLIKKGWIKPGCFREWSGRVFVLGSENDFTQGKGDFIHYERMFGRPVERINLGDMGHTALLFDPQRFAQLLQEALS